jgi:cytochrome c553
MWEGITRTALAAGAIAAAALVAAPSVAAPAPDGASLYAQRCAQCHDRPRGHVPSRESLSFRTPTNIVMALEAGAMQPQATGLSPEQVNAIAGFLTAGAAARATPLHRWVRQLVRHDDWAAGCSFKGPCPEPAGDDADIAASTILVKLPTGRDVLVAAQKSGVVYGLDPAASGSTVYVPISDSMPTHPAEPARSGLGALDAATGKVLWWTPAPRPQCSWGSDDCRAAQSQAVTAIAGLVFSGSQDGHLRAYEAHTGRIVWDFDAARHVPAVNAESAAGGSLDAGGPVVADGVVYLNSGYGQFLGRGGNVLLALSVGSR